MREVMDDDGSDRIGSFSIHESWMRKRWRSLLPLFAQMVVTRAEYLFHTRCIEYTATSDLFAPVPPAVEFPEYVIVAYLDEMTAIQRFGVVPRVDLLGRPYEPLQRPLNARW